VTQKRPIINIEELDYHEWSHGDRFEGRMGEIAGEIGAKKLGYNLTIVPAGKRAFPFHSHHVNEEMFYVLEGTGEIRIGNKTYPIKPGDVINCPAGGPETGHQIINTMDDRELKYLAVSTYLFPEICEYPDSGKKSIRHYWPSGQDGEEETLRFILKEGEGQVDYWEDEE
jgi:uncharacterized cupin superfamily protein